MFSLRSWKLQYERGVNDAIGLGVCVRVLLQ